MIEKEINNYIELFENSSLSSLEIEQGDFKIKMTKETNAVSVPVSTNTAPVTISKETSDIEVENQNLLVKAPIVGVYYEAPTPNDPPFVKVGDKVEAGQMLCLVEAMKMMNELKSPASGIIKKINGENGKLVEFDQVLFEVEPC